MTRHSIKEYAQAIHKRFKKGSRQLKARILDEFVAVTRLHRKSAIRLLARPEGVTGQSRRGRRKVYSVDTVAALKVIWRASGGLCSIRLRPFIPELTRVLRAQEELFIRDDTAAEPGQLSASTIDRMTRRWRQAKRGQGLSLTKPGTHLKNAIPIKTFSEWENSRPGFIQVDLVAHCGDRVEGFYLNTLSAVDVATGWFEPLAVWGKGQERVGAAIHQLRQLLPMPLLGLGSDNGREFINRGLYEYCGRQRITFTRSRAYKKNDNCHVEQKNWSVIRRQVGYQRYSSQAAYEALEDLYRVLRLYLNFFQPVLKLVSKSRQGAHLHKVYDEAQTPYSRLLKSGVLTEGKQQALANIYNGLNPVALYEQIAQAQRQLNKLGERTVSWLPKTIDDRSVTFFMKQLN
jgi:hypothetical protein